MVITYLHIELASSIASTSNMINRQYTIPLRNYGIAFSQAICLILKILWKVIAKNFGRLLILLDFLIMKTIQDLVTTHFGWSVWQLLFVLSHT